MLSNVKCQAPLTLISFTIAVWLCIQSGLMGAFPFPFPLLFLYETMALTVQNRVWGVPELMKLIAKSLSRSDCSYLARTTRLCFHSLVEYVWCEVDGAIDLLALLPGAKWIPAEEEQTTFDQIVSILCIGCLALLTVVNDAIAL